MTLLSVGWCLIPDVQQYPFPAVIVWKHLSLCTGKPVQQPGEATAADEVSAAAATVTTQPPSPAADPVADDPVTDSVERAIKASAKPRCVAAQSQKKRAPAKEVLLAGANSAGSERQGPYACLT